MASHAPPFTLFLCKLGGKNDSLFYSLLNNLTKEFKILESNFKTWQNLTLTWLINLFRNRYHSRGGRAVAVLHLPLRSDEKKSPCLWNQTPGAVFIEV